MYQRLAPGYPARLGESEGTKWWMGRRDQRTPGSPSRMMLRSFSRSERQQTSGIATHPRKHAIRLCPGFRGSEYNERD
jgi:hypothetical protein